MTTGAIEEDTFISQFVPVSRWKDIRLDLIKGTLPDSDNPPDWESAYKLLKKRIDTRFIDSIKWILSKKKDVGEGFSAVALQCILIEFLEALYEGKVYTTSKQPRGFEYHSSKELFCNFLLKREPFSRCFKQRENAEGFFDNIRCGLLHEAATKGSSRINNAPTHEMIVFFEQGDPRNMRIYRENFFNAILQFIGEYRKELLKDTTLKTNFIRRMDDICGIRHEYYFAYGSNMFLPRLLERIGKYHYGVQTAAIGYEFSYNKKGADKTGKANLKQSTGSRVYGICFEIDELDFNELNKYEQGYKKESIELLVNGKKECAYTYKSSDTDDDLRPSGEYKDLILRGAEYWKLDETYVSRYLNK